MKHSAEMLEALKAWAEIVPDIFRTIGPPGDYGYGTKRGVALEDLMTLSDSIWAEPHNVGPLTVRLATARLSETKWPKDVANRMPRYHVELLKLQFASGTIRSVMEKDGLLMLPAASNTNDLFAQGAPQ